jgi:hypothetical protein
MSVNSNPTAAKAESKLSKCSSSILFYTLRHTTKFGTILFNIQNELMTLTLFSSSKIKFYEAICIARICIFLIKILSQTKK